eukprot:scaffold21499_cov40-Prasinocladus_malaysianus.AAC.1
MEMVMEVDSILTVLKSNVKGTRDILADWVANIMFINRKDNRVYSYDELNSAFKELIHTRHSAISDKGKEIVKLLSSSNRTLKVSKAASSWKQYVDYISEIVISGFADTITSTINYLHQQLDPESIAKNELGPLVEIQLELVAPEIAWKPELACAGGDGVRDMFNSWLKSFLDIGGLMKRLDIGEGDYSKELEEDYVVYDAMSEVQAVVLANEATCEAFRNTYRQYDYLYKKDLQEALQEFLSTEGVALDDGSKDEPTLEAFEGQIQKYRGVQQEINALKTSATFGWVKVDAKPIKKALATWATKWTYLFTHYLSQKVTNSMGELYQFMASANGVLDQRLSTEKDPEADEEEEDPYATGAAAEGEEGEEEGPSEEEIKASNQKILYSIMACMRDIRKRTDKTDNMFEPLKQTVQLLLQYQVSLPEEVLKQLEEAPLGWKSLKKKMFQRREQLAPVQQSEAIEIRRKSDAFTAKVEDFRKFFQKMAPFTVPNAELKLECVGPAYERLDAFHHGTVTCPDSGTVYGSVMEIIAESESLRENQDLFELFVSDYVFLTRCSEELGYLKSLWDTVGSVMYTFNAWYATPWDKIDTDFLMEESKKLSKEIKTLNKAVRNYEVFRLLEDSLKAMLTSLPL